MRVASWVFILCTLLAAAGFFVPSLEVRVGGASINRRTALSIYQVESHRTTVRQALAAYRGSSKAKVLGTVVGKVAPKTHGALRGRLGDVTDAMSTIDEVTDDDVRTAGIALGALIAVYCGLSLIAAGLALAGLVAGQHRRRRLALALVVSVLLAAVAVAVHVGLREVAWEANDELVSIFALRGGAYLIPLAAIGALAAGIALVVLERRRPGALAHAIQGER